MTAKKKRLKHHSIDGLISFISDEQTRERLNYIQLNERLSLSAICRLSVSLLWVIYEAEGKLPMPSGMRLENFKKSPGRRPVYMKKRSELVKRDE